LSLEAAAEHPPAKNAHDPQTASARAHDANVADDVDDAHDAHDDRFIPKPPEDARHRSAGAPDAAVQAPRPSGNHAK
jgi:hypothetical protein